MKKRFSEYLYGLKIKSFLAPFFKLLEALLELLIPLAIAEIIDIGIPNNDSIFIIKRFVFLLIIATLGFGFALCAQYFSAFVASKYSCRLRKGLFSHIQTLSFRELDQLGTSTLLTRMSSDINQVQTGINMFLRLFLRSPFIVFGALIMAFVVDSSLAIILLIMIPILFVIVGVIMKITLPKYQKIQENLDYVTKETHENLTGVRVIRAFTYEDNQKMDFDNKNQKHSSLQIFVSKISSLMNPLTVLIVNLGIVCLLYLGGIKVNQGNLTSGQVVALYNYIGYILVELVKFANLIVTITKALASYKRVEKVFDINSSLTFKNKELINDDHISFNNVSFKYFENGKEAVKNINFKIKKNQKVGIIGGTGSGKSTLINLLSHNYNVNEGQIILDGYPLDSYSLKEVKDKIGLVPQKAVLFEGTIRSNLLVGNKNASDEEIYGALKISQAIDVVNSKEDKLDEKVEQQGRNFSGGQKQRLTIARAILKKPEILILDDSSSALDYKTDKQLRSELDQIKDMTVLMISQRTSSLLSCDHIILLDKGEIVDQGTHEELLKRCSLYQEIHYTQFEKESE